MKTLILCSVLLLAIPAGLLAQYTGGSGRGDIFITQTCTLLNGGIIFVSGSSGADGTYESLTNSSGAFSRLNETSQSGKSIVVRIACISSSETGTYSLNAGAWTTLIIYPKKSGIAITGSGSGPIITLNGADNVTIDGRVNASGAEKDMTIKRIYQFCRRQSDKILFDYRGLFLVGYLCSYCGRRVDGRR
jgi:hypothetical protein